MNKLRKELSGYLSRSPKTLKQIAENLSADPLDIFNELCNMEKDGLIEKTEYNISGQLDPDYCRKYKARCTLK